MVTADVFRHQPVLAGDRPQIERWLSTRQDHHDRADWAIVRLHDGAFLGLAVFDFNPRARRVYEKCGFIHEGRLRDGRLWQGKRYDTLLMSILRTDPRPARRPAVRRFESPHADPPYF